MTIGDVSRRSAAQSDVASALERREQIARRFKTFWPTSIRTATGVYRAHVLNISRTGAKIHAQPPVDTDQTLEIAIGDHWYGASVRWRRGETFGIAFHGPMPDVVVQNSLMAG